MANRLLVNGTGYTLTDTAPPSGYNSIKVCGRYLWGKTTRDSNSGGFYFIKGETKYYACLNPCPTGSITLTENNSSWTVPAGVNRIKVNINGNVYVTVTAGQIVKRVVTKSSEGDANTICYVDNKVATFCSGSYSIDIDYGPSINA